jgi:hypothetical protein
MKLSNLIKTKILNDLNLRLKLALAMEVTEQSIRNNANRNSTNNKLTSYTAITVIKEVTGLTDAEILEENTILV